MSKVREQQAAQREQYVSPDSQAQGDSRRGEDAHRDPAHQGSGDENPAHEASAPEGLTHIDPQGNARMVDVSAKSITVRSAAAGGWISMGDDAFRALIRGDGKKGDVLATARLAGIMAAKRCAELIPLCHVVPLEHASVDFTLDEEALRVHALCHTRCSGKTGVEMEALTGASIALLTVYDMLKALDRSMELGEIRVLEKDGGRSGRYVAESARDARDGKP